MLFSTLVSDGKTFSQEKDVTKANWADSRRLAIFLARMGVGGEKRVRIHLLLQEVFANHLMITMPRVVLMALVTTHVGFFSRLLSKTD